MAALLLVSPIKDQCPGNVFCFHAWEFEVSRSVLGLSIGRQRVA